MTAVADGGSRETVRRIAILAAAPIAAAAVIPVLQAALTLAHDPSASDPFTPVQRVIVLVPALAAALFGASTLVHGRLPRTLAIVAATALCMAALRIVMGALINPLPLAEAAFLVPACAYVALSRRPLWWAAAVAASAPLVFVLSTSFYA